MNVLYNVIVHQGGHLTTVSNVLFVSAKIITESHNFIPLCGTGEVQNNKF